VEEGKSERRERERGGVLLGFARERGGMLVWGFPR
jgi:hypothetical protein